ncbi:NmrA family NAD(P)-binding protein [Nonomuraea sp. FMUSA5-5]|uniref:NmrA family NAD(P)-binding protein n=1 Tax=Nonomuraea composti TaxID=2720023 RepID=A0ABX1BPR6_9ACTN|nr:NmrA family NAD(P)-binding protein [Nonomuraea sp. FMUSA5-5]NJP97819.1 NmrA family NAD(P)-binding protein [Nonomuraea sp. FMUSA5-5]
MIVVTGVSGALGGAILGGLRAAGGLEVAGASRSGDGTAVRHADFDRPDTLKEAFEGARVLVFVSAGYAEDDVVLARHGAAVRAAADAGVEHVIYTSLAASGERLTIALAHRWTEARLAEAPFDVTVLRNGLYAEIPAGLALMGAAAAAESGVFAAPLGAGRVSVVARDDLAAVAVRVAAEAWQDVVSGGERRHAGRTYELEGLSAVGGHDLAEVLSEVLGRPVSYLPVPLGAARAGLAGLEAYQAGHTMSTFANIGAGLLEARRSDLPAFLDAPRSARDLIAAVVRAGVGASH